MPRLAPPPSCSGAGPIVCTVVTPEIDHPDVHAVGCAIAASAPNVCAATLLGVRRMPQHEDPAALAREVTGFVAYALSMTLPSTSTGRTAAH